MDEPNNRRCRYRGRVYVIPDIWITGWRHGATLRGEPDQLTDAVAYWAQQVAYDELAAAASKGD
jgi:hypothetical protein